MKKIIFIKKLSFVALTGLVIALSIAGCSDDKQKALPEKTVKVKPVHSPFDHSHDVPVADVQKHKFEHDFASQCVQREMKNSVNKEADERRYNQSCMCIASFLMKDLTAAEAEKFLDEHKNAQSLVIKYENAAYHCLQQNAHPKGPDFTRGAQLN
jgi:hypothetical protein